MLSRPTWGWCTCGTVSRKTPTMELSLINNAIAKATGVRHLNPMQVAAVSSRRNRIVLLSPTGSGKTLAYVGSLLARLTEKELAEPVLRAVIIAPSRELVRQIYDVVRAVSVRFSAKTLALYGGNSFNAEESSLLGEMPSIIVATPGRLLDHIGRGTLDVGSVGLLVLDEYDKILELGFRDEMSRISARIGSRLPGRTLDFVMVTSATRLAEVPGFVDIDKAEIIDFTTDGTSDRLSVIEAKSATADKLEALAALIRQTASDGPVIVFVNHRESAERVGNYLSKQKISTVVYHGGLDQQKREMALARFDSRAAAVMVCTDLGGRGIDIDNVAAVIHYHPAPDKDVYTHRNGRTARIDRTGAVYLLTGPDEYPPEFADVEREIYPDITLDAPVMAEKTLVYINRGKRDKISRGDILGFLGKQAGVPGDAVGKITLGLSYSLVAVDPAYSRRVIDASKTAKLKNTRIVASLVS